MSLILFYIETINFYVTLKFFYDFPAPISFYYSLVGMLMERLISRYLVSLSFDVLEKNVKFSCSRFLMSLLLTFTYMDPLYLVLK
jgi:hypothetical protein